MTIGQTRFWRDGLTLRSSNYQTMDQPLEVGLCKRWRMPEFKVYETEAERGGTEVRLAAGFLWFWINTLLFYTKRDTKRWDDSGSDWGFYFMDRVSFVWRWGKKYVSFDLPFFTSVFLKKEIVSLDRKRVVHLCDSGDFGEQEEAKKKHSARFPYRYECLDGEAQDCIATVCVERWTRRTKWTPFKQVRDCIWVQFSEEMGPRRGSWKGGVTGCGWDLHAGETVVHGLRRMEAERRFER